MKQYFLNATALFSCGTRAITGTKLLLNLSRAQPVVAATQPWLYRAESWSSRNHETKCGLHRIYWEGGVCCTLLKGFLDYTRARTPCVSSAKWTKHIDVYLNICNTTICIIISWRVVTCALNVHYIRVYYNI